MPGVCNKCSWMLSNSQVDTYLIVIGMEMTDDTKMLYSTSCLFYDSTKK